MIEANPAAEGVGSCWALGAILRGHLQELPSSAREGWDQKKKKKKGRKKRRFFTFSHIPFYKSKRAVQHENKADRQIVTLITAAFGFAHPGERIA